MKKKILVLLLAGMLCGSLAACAGNTLPKAETSTKPQTASDAKTDSGKDAGGKKAPS